MRTRVVEATNGLNWGKFLVGQLDHEWGLQSAVSGSTRPLLDQLGWDPTKHIWVLDLQTGEGAYFRHGGLASADLKKHRIWVCPLYEPFLEWLYKQPLDLQALPAAVHLNTEGALAGYRRPGPGK